jgi:hypothetical protein
MISQSDSDSIKNHFSGKTETFLFLSESGTVPNAPLESSLFLGFGCFPFSSTVKGGCPVVKWFKMVVITCAHKCYII